MKKGCGVWFETKERLNSHVDVCEVTGKLKPCIVCGKKFKPGLKLEEHTDGHTVYPRYRCLFKYDGKKECNLPYQTKASLGRHLKTHEDAYQDVITVSRNPEFVKVFAVNSKEVGGYKESEMEKKRGTRGLGGKDKREERYGKE